MNLFDCNRPDVDGNVIKAVVHEVENRLFKKLETKGRGLFVSTHEILGAVTEEFNELDRAVESDKLYTIEDELADVAVAAVFGLVSMRQGAEVDRVQRAMEPAE